MKTVRLAIFGFGVIGRGFAKVLLEKHDYIAERHGVDLRLVGIAEKEGCLVNPEGIDLKEALATAKESSLSRMSGWMEGDASAMLDAAGPDIVAELVPSSIENGEPGAGIIKSSLERGIHVVSSDKCAIAKHFPELMRFARKNGVWLLFEGAAGGGMPLMNLYRECLQADTVTSVVGILNGTTNYILTKMSKGGMDLRTALREAQELGYAEADPSYDVEGIDAAAKAVILANDIMGMEKGFEEVKITGIMGITKEAVQLAKKNGYVIKLIAEIKEGRLSVGPKLIPEGHPLNVQSNLNAVMLKTDVGRDITIVGRGAGGRETQSAVFSDILRICNDI